MATDDAAAAPETAADSLELVEYRIAMPCSVEEYRLGQIYMIAKHCRQQSQASEGVQVMLNEPYESPDLGPGRYCEKRIYIGHRLASWINRLLPVDGIYVLEKSYNHFPYTKTEYSCSVLTRLSIRVDTQFVDGSDGIENIFNLSQPDLERRRVVSIDIAADPLDPRKYSADEDVTILTSSTGRLPLLPGWRLIQQLLLHAHRQAAAWMDDWLGMSEDEIRAIERQLFNETNRLVDGKTSPNQQEAEVCKESS